tara:strand:+ start:54 stop:1016 length:963 start_codon:yes stop_codon:yes gene_type:complete
MVIKNFLLLVLSFPVYAVVTPNDFIDHYINEGEYGEIYKIDLLIFKNEFIEDVDLKEKWKTLEPLDLSQELFMIKDQPTLLIEKPVFKEKNQNNLISLKVENLIEEVTDNEEEITEEKPMKVRLNLFERILYEKEFEEVKKKLDKNNEYKVLHSISWYQPLVEKDKSAFIFIENSKDQIKTYGEVLIYKDRYLHFDAKLRLSEKTDFLFPEPVVIKTINFNDLLKEKSKEEEKEEVPNNNYWMETIFNNVRVNIGDFSKWILENEINDSPLDLNQQESSTFKYNDLYEINQEIKVEENKYHFIDHPYFGVIVRISSLQTN